MMIIKLIFGLAKVEELEAAGVKVTGKLTAAEKWEAFFKKKS